MRRSEREMAGHPPSYAEAKKIKSLTLHTDGCLRASLRVCSALFSSLLAPTNLAVYISWTYFTDAKLSFTTADFFSTYDYYCFYKQMI